MKKKWITLILFIVLLNGVLIKTYSQKIDSMALKIVEAHLKVISNYIETKKNGELFTGGGSVSFLTKLSGISSEAGGSFAGPNAPTENDYRRWFIWFNYFKESLRWDSNRKLIIIYKEMDATGW